MAWQTSFLQVSLFAQRRNRPLLAALAAYLYPREDAGGLSR